MKTLTKLKKCNFYVSTKKIVVILIIFISVSSKSQTTIIPENPNQLPWSDPTTLLIEKVGLNNIWEYTKIINITKADSLWYKKYENTVFNTAFLASLTQNINTKSMNDSVVTNYPDTVITVFNSSYLQKRKTTVVWSAEGKYDSYHTTCTQRKIVVTDRITTISQDTLLMCTNFTNKLTYLYDKNCTKHYIAFAQAFLEDCNHRTSNYYKYLFQYNPTANYDNSNKNLISVINLNVTPNPSSGNVITASYFLPETGNVIIELQNAVTFASQQIFNGNKNAGNHTKTFNVNNLTAGTYYVKLTYQNQIFTQILIIN